MSHQDNIYNGSGHRYDSFVKYRNGSIILCILIIAAFLLFFRNSLQETVYVETQQDSLLIKSYTGDMITVPYTDIRSVKLTDRIDFGTKISGSDTVRVRSGIWKNESWGKYHLFAAKKAKDYFIVTTADSVIVFNYESTGVTEEMYPAFQTLMTQKGLSDKIDFQNSTTGTASEK